MGRNLQDASSSIREHRWPPPLLQLLDVTFLRSHPMRWHALQELSLHNKA